MRLLSSIEVDRWSAQKARPPVNTHGAVLGGERQHLNLITHALGVNALAVHRHRLRSNDPPLPAAA